MKIKTIESKSNAPNKQSFYVYDKGRHNLLLILIATPEELLSLAEEEIKDVRDTE